MGISITEALRLVPDKFRDVPKIYAEYSLLYLPLAAAAAGAKQTVNTQDDSYFLAMRVKAYATDTAVPPVEVPMPQATYLLQIASNIVQPDNNPVHIGNIVCNQQKKGGETLDYPIWIPPATTLSCLMTNLTGATAYNIRIKICGMRFLVNFKGSST